MLQFILLILVCLLFLPIVYNSIIAAPPVPTQKKDVERMIAVARIKPGETVYDLGAGDGRLVMCACQHSKAKKIIGFELSPLHFFWCKLKVILAGVTNRVAIKWKNFFKIDLSGVDVVLCFLTPKAFEQLVPKFEHELKPGARIVTYLFPIKAWEPTEVNRPSLNHLPIFLYQR